MHYYPLKDHQVFNVYPLYGQALLSTSLISTLWDVWVWFFCLEFSTELKVNKLL